MPGATRATCWSPRRRQARERCTSSTYGGSAERRNAPLDSNGPVALECRHIATALPARWEGALRNRPHTVSGAGTLYPYILPSFQLGRDEYSASAEGGTFDHRPGDAARFHPRRGLASP